MLAVPVLKIFISKILHINCSGLNTSKPRNCSGLNTSKPSTNQRTCWEETTQFRFLENGRYVSFSDKSTDIFTPFPHINTNILSQSRNALKSTKSP